MTANTRDRWNLVLLAVLWIVAILLVGPAGEFPVTDDFAYTESVRTLVDTGRLRFSDWNATTLFTQVYWGALFGKLFGTSNLALRCSTLVAALLGGFAFYRLARLARATPHVALLATLVLLFNPLSFLFAFSFMSDVPYTTLQIVAMWLLAAGGLAASRSLRTVGWVAAVGALLIRQVGFAVPVGTAVEALARRRRPTLRGVAVALVPFVAFLLVQKGFQYWLHAEGLTPKMYGRQIPSLGEKLKHPVAEARNVVTVAFHCLLYLGLFVLPLAVAVYGSWMRSRVRKTGVAVVVGSAVVVSIATIVVGIRFPTWITSLHRSGIGQDLFGRMTPEWIAIPLTILAVTGGVLMVAAIVVAGLGWYERREEQRFDITVFALATGLCLLAPLPFLFLRLDRYLLPITPCVLLVLLETVRAMPPLRSMVRTGFVSVGVMALASIAGMHDYMAAKRAHWAAYTDLARHVPADHIDGGWVVNGPVSYGRYGEIDGVAGWFASDDFTVSTTMRPGYRLVASYPIDNWLPWNWNDVRILVAQREPKAPVTPRR